MREPLFVTQVKNCFEYLTDKVTTLGSLKKVAKYKIGEYNRSGNGHIRMKRDNVYEYFPALHSRV